MRPAVIPLATSYGSMPRPLPLFHWNPVDAGNEADDNEVNNIFSFLAKKNFPSTSPIHIER